MLAPHALRENARTSTPRAKLYPLDKPLLRLSKAGDYITRRDLVRGGVQVIGAQGSAKTSTVLRTLMHCCFLDGHGALVLCCKPDAAAFAIKMARLSGRSKDVVHVTIGSHVYRFIEDAIRHHGSGKGVVQQIVERISEAEHIANRKRGGAPQEEFWTNSKNNLIGDGSLVDMLAHDGELSLLRLLQYIQTLPGDRQALEEPERHEILKALAVAEKKCPPSRRAELQLAKDFFTKELVSVGERCRSSIAITATVGLNPLLRYPLVDLFDGPGVEIDPATCIRENKIVVLDVPTKVYGDTVAKIAGCLFKLGFQDAMHRRWESHDGNPEALVPFGNWADESQNFISESDLHFVDTCRSTRGYIVYATQNLPAYEHELGSTPQAKKLVESLLGNLGIVIACQNSDHETNQWVADRIGKEWRWIKGLHPGRRSDGSDDLDAPGFEAGYSQQMVHQFPPEIFMGLEYGTEASNPPLTAQAVVFNNGRDMAASGKRALICRFTQRDSMPRVITVLWEKQPFARLWERHVKWGSVLRWFLRHRAAGAAKFRLWANFWSDGVFFNDVRQDEPWREEEYHNGKS